MEMTEHHQLVTTANPAAIYIPHPLCAGVGRQMIYGGFLPGESIDAYLQRQNIHPGPRAFVLFLNDELVPREHWSTVQPIEGDLLTLRAALHNGGGQGSDPTRTILAIAVLTVAPQVGVWGGILSGGTVSPLIGQALFSIGGMLLINHLLPIEPPEADRQPSPTYSLAGSQNRARLFEPLPLVLGVHRIYPDYGSKPFTEFVGDDQYLNQVFNFGLSNITLSDHKIGDTLLSSFNDVITEISGPDGALASFPGNVDTISGGDLAVIAGTFITKTGSVDTTAIKIELQGIVYHQNEDGIEPLQLSLTMEYREVGSGTWLPLTGANPVLIQHGTREPLRWGYKKSGLASGQYEVRINLNPTVQLVRTAGVSDGDGGIEYITGYLPRTFTVPPGPNVIVALSWHQLQSYQPNTADYTGQTRMAIAIKASGQLNGSIEAINAIASASVPVWNGASWVTQISSNPAWQYLWLARGKFIGAQRVFGAGLPDARIDIEQIKIWGAWCDTKGLECNLIFDRGGQSVDEHLRIVARCGRASPTWANGILGVVYDDDSLPVSGHYGMGNIVRGSFQVNYLTGRLADEFVIAWTNPALGYQRDTVRATVPGVISPANPVTIELRGITSQAQAGREANLMAAEQVFRRRQISWETDMEGMPNQRGDVVTLSHDLTQWGYSGRLVSGTTTVLQLDRAVPFTPLTQHYVAIRFPDGSTEIVDVLLVVGESAQLDLTTPLSASPDADPDYLPRDYLWFFDPTATPGKKVKLTDIKPLGEYRLRLTATDEDPDYYLREFEAYTYVTPGAFGVKVPVISNLQSADTLILIGNTFGTRITVTWDVDGQYGGALVRAGAAGEALKDIGRTLDRRLAFEWIALGDVVIEVQLFNPKGQIGPAGRASITHVVQGKLAPPGDVQNFVALQNGSSIVLKWTPPLDVDYLGTDIRYGKRGASSYEDATPFDGDLRASNVTTVNVPPGDWTFYAKHFDTSGNASVNAASYDVVFRSDFDIIVQLEQAPAWAGTLVNFARHWTGVIFPESTSTIDALGWRVFDEVSPDPAAICTYEAPEIDIDFDDDVRAWGDIQSYLVPGETTGVADPQLQLDYREAAASYDGFENWNSGQVRGRYFKFKLVLDTTRGVAAIDGFLPTVDLLEHETELKNITVAPGGSTITFAQAFHLPPAVKVHENSGTALVATRSNITTTGFDSNVFNLSGANVGGLIDATITGV